jgi:hypothetical protein
LALTPGRGEPAPDAAAGDGGPFRQSAGPAPPHSPAPSMWGRAIPRSAGLAYLFAVLSSASMGLFCYVVSAQVSAPLGAMMFVGLPFGMAFWTAFCVSYHLPTTRRAAVLKGLSVIGIGLGVTLTVGWEGVACLVMATPILAVIGWLGAWIGWLCARAPGRVQLAPLVLLLIPALLGVDLVRPPATAPLAVVSTVLVHATPETVWRNVIAFPPIEEPPAPIFALVAMPLEARIDGRDPGATRRCVFTNGTFVEPIQIWNEPRELTFGVLSQPGNIDQYIQVERGQFLITPRDDGTTELRGTTWYRLHLFPLAYWNGWARTFLHAIHLRVLEHVKHLAEHPEAAQASAPAQPLWMATANQTCRCTTHAH